jgi:hypothetical protein
LLPAWQRDCISTLVMSGSRSRQAVASYHLLVTDDRTAMAETEAVGAK